MEDAEIVQRHTQQAVATTAIFEVFAGVILKHEDACSELHSSFCFDISSFPLID